VLAAFVIRGSHCVRACGRKGTSVVAAVQVGAGMVCANFNPKLQKLLVPDGCVGLDRRAGGCDLISERGAAKMLNFRLI
jgi:hypothetical protein